MTGRIERYEYLDAAGNVTRTVTGFSSEADAGIHEGEVAWRLVGAAVPPPAGTSEAIRDVLLRRLATIRYEYETSGTQTPDGMRVLTGRDDATMTLGAYSTLRDGFESSVEWKGADGWRTVTLEEIDPIWRACSSHIQKSFRAERRVVDQVAARDDAALAGFDVSAAFVAAFESQ